MNKILVSEFKAKCIQRMREVKATGRPLMVTVRGEPLVEVRPPGGGERKALVLGTLGGSLRLPADKELVYGDFADEWEINQ